MNSTDKFNLVSDGQLQLAYNSWVAHGQPKRGKFTKTQFEEQLIGYRGANGKAITKAWRERLGLETEMKQVCADCGCERIKEIPK